MDALSGSVGSYLGQQGVSAMQVGQLRWVSSSSSFVPEHPLIHFQSPSGKQVNPCNREGCRQQSFAVGLTLCTGRAGMYRLLFRLCRSKLSLYSPRCMAGTCSGVAFFQETKLFPPNPTISGLACSPLPAILVLHYSVLLQIYILPALDWLSGCSGLSCFEEEKESLPVLLHPIFKGMRPWLTLENISIFSYYS